MLAFRTYQVRIFITVIWFWSHSQPSLSQSKYWIEFIDKDIENYDYSKFLSDEAIKNRIRNGSALVQYSDAPINTVYIDSLIVKKVDPCFISRWFNSVSAQLNERQLLELSQCSFVKKITPLGPDLVPTGDDILEFTSVLEQLGVKDFNRYNVTGKGVSIGIIDAGFAGADSNDYFKHIFSRNGVSAYKDFLNPGRKDFYEQVTSADYHGRKVWRLIGGYSDTEKVQYGLATGATYYLARTEDGVKEYRVEEDAWVAAIEWMDSLGVRLVSTSLGYTNSFDDPTENYRADQMDGKTSLVAKAAEMAVRDKGIFVVISAGNEGNIDWETLSTPADAESALAVGACGYKSYKKAGYSSVGPTYTNFVKPDVVCFSTNGTSYSAPSIAGFVACLIELKPEISNDDLRELIFNCSHLYPYPNNYIGYGVPNACKAIKYLKESIHIDAPTIKVKGKEWLHTYEHEPEITPVCFHKKDDIHVLKQEELEIEERKAKREYSSKEERNKMKIERKKLKKEGKYVAQKYKLIKVTRAQGAVKTTVHTGDQVFELIWE